MQLIVSNFDINNFVIKSDNNAVRYIKILLNQAHAWFFDFDADVGMRVRVCVLVCLPPGFEKLFM